MPTKEYGVLYGTSEPHVDLEPLKKTDYIDWFRGSSEAGIQGIVDAHPSTRTLVVRELGDYKVVQKLPTTLGSLIKHDGELKVLGTENSWEPDYWSPVNEIEQGETALRITGDWELVFDAKGVQL